jgi:hypothetical protein
MFTHGQGLFPVLAKHDTLGLHDGVLGKVMDVVKSVIEGRLGNPLVFAGSQAGEDCVGSKGAVDKFGCRDD